jgi:hypothetical protein
MKKCFSISLVIIGFALLLGQMNEMVAQEPKNKHSEKASAERKKDSKEAEKELIDQHEKIQSKATRKMMKENKKKSKRLKKGQQPVPF